MEKIFYIPMKKPPNTAAKTQPAMIVPYPLAVTLPTPFEAPDPLPFPLAPVPEVPFPFPVKPPPLPELPVALGPPLVVVAEVEFPIQKLALPLSKHNTRGEREREKSNPQTPPKNMSPPSPVLSH